MKSKNALVKVLLLLSLVLSFCGCGNPPAQIYGNDYPPAYNPGAPTNSYYDDSHPGSKNPNQNPDSRPSSTPTPTPTDTGTAPTCTIPTPIVTTNYFHNEVYLTVTATVQSAVPILYVYYGLNTAGTYPQNLGYGYKAPYKFQFLANGLSYGEDYGIVATLVDQNGKEYDSVCATGFILNK